MTANIVSDITTEDGTNALNNWAEEGGSGFTMTIQPRERPAPRHECLSALIKLNGANRVTFDGSIDGGGTDRSLTSPTTAPLRRV